MINVQISSDYKHGDVILIRKSPGNSLLETAMRLKKLMKAVMN